MSQAAKIVFAAVVAGLCAMTMTVVPRVPLTVDRPALHMTIAIEVRL